MHLDDERTQRWLHAELDGPARQQVAAHLAACTECQAQVAAAEAEEGWIRARLGDLPDPRPVSSTAGLRGRAVSLRRWRWAATIVLSCAAAGTAYAMPGSPLPAWVERIGGWISGRESSPPPTPATPAPVTPSGIVLPVEPSLTIRFAGEAGGEARVVVVDSGSITVQVRSGQAAFTTSSGLLVVESGAAGSRIEVEVPRGAPSVSIEVQGERRFLLRDDWGKRRLSYEIKKFQKGHYFQVNFLGSGKEVGEIERLMRIDADILRYMSVLANDEVKDVETRVVEAAKQAAEQAQRRAEREAERAAREEREKERERGLPVGDDDDEEPRFRADDEDEE